jgi:hypothetical protein
VIGVLVVVAQLAAVQSVDSTYASPALRDLIDRAAVANAIVPPTLASYRAHVETEMAMILVDTLGRERTGQVEQMGGTVQWRPDSGFFTNVEGYRTQSSGVPISLLGVIRNWTVPMLYGQRLLLGLDFSETPEPGTTKVGQRRDTLRAVHPFGADRRLFYRFTGGDTIGFITTQTRRFPLVQIIAHPNLAIEANFAAFDGEIDIDGDRGEIVRMRGRFVVSQRMSRYRGLTGALVKASGVVGVAYIEFENAEHLGRYWLPATQRVELQTTTPLANGVRFTFRTITRFSDFDIEQQAADTSRLISGRRRTNFASTDSLAKFGDWRSELGSTSASVSATDFDDIEPPQWKQTGEPRVVYFPSRIDHVLRFNRVEGLFTGAEVSYEFRDDAPGLVARANAGWAWSEETARGSLSLSRSWSRSSTSLIAERRLVPTQDFEREFASLGRGIGAFLSSIEEADYVDRWSASVAHARVIRSVDHALLTVQAAVARDHDVAASLEHGPIVHSRAFLPNRHARTGSFVLGSLGYELHPNVTGELLEPGFGFSMNGEGATGQLQWTRFEGSVALRHYLGPVTIVGRADAGVVLSNDPPPQTLFELGGISGRLEGYSYKEFAGDRAAVARTYASYALPVLRAPYRFGRWLVPGLTPGLAASIDAGWAELSSDAARASVLEMGDGTEANAVSHPTGRIRSTVFAGLTFFSNSVQVGFARPIDQQAPWKFRFQLGGSY